MASYRYSHYKYACSLGFMTVRVYEKSYFESIPHVQNNQCDRHQ